MKHVSHNAWTIITIANFVDIGHYYYVVFIIFFFFIIFIKHDQNNCIFVVAVSSIETNLPYADEYFGSTYIFDYNHNQPNWSIMFSHYKYI